MMIPEQRLQGLLLSVHPEAVRLPPGWIEFATHTSIQISNGGVTLTSKTR